MKLITINCAIFLIIFTSCKRNTVCPPKSETHYYTPDSILNEIPYLKGEVVKFVSNSNDTLIFIVENVIEYSEFEYYVNGGGPDCGLNGIYCHGKVVDLYGKSSILPSIHIKCEPKSHKLSYDYINIFDHEGIAIDNATTKSLPYLKFVQDSITINSKWEIGYYFELKNVLFSQSLGILSFTYKSKIYKKI